MSFRDAFNRRRTPGYAGGTLEDQTQREGRRIRPAGFDPSTGAINEAAVELDDQGNIVRTIPRAEADLLAKPRFRSDSVFDKTKRWQDIRIPRALEREGESTEQIMRRIELGNDAMGNTGTEQRFRDGLSDPPLKQEMPRGLLTRPRRAMPVPEEAPAPVAQPSFKTRFAQPQQEGFGSSDEPFGSTRQRRTQPRDVIADDSQYLRDLQTQPRTKKDKIMDVIDAVNAGFGNKPRVTKTKRERQIAEAEGRLGTELSVGQKQAQINAAQTRPQIQQASLDEREVNNALSQYNRIEHYDPDNPADAALRKYFESRGLALPKKDKYRRPIATWANGQLVLTDDQGTRRATIDGEVVEDEARKPTGVTVGDQTFQVPQTQAEQSVRQRTENAANRGAADTRSRRAQEGQDRRLQRRLAAPSKAGTGGRPSTAQTKAANALAAKYNYARKAEMSADVPVEKKAVIQREREVLWQQIMDTYPGMFEADEKTFELRPKATSDLDQPVYGKPKAGNKLSEGTVRQAAIDAGLDPDEAVRRAKAKGRL